jgi:hypothetical protein
MRSHPGERCDISKTPMPVLSKFLIASIADSITGFGRTQGPALKLCAFIFVRFLCIFIITKKRHKITIFFSYNKQFFKKYFFLPRFEHLLCFILFRTKNKDRYAERIKTGSRKLEN